MTDTRTEIEQLTPLQRALLAMKEMRARLDSLERAQSEPIAIVGLGCRFPGGATGPEGYWQLLSEGADAITEVPADRWDIEEYYDPDPDAPGRMCTRHGGFLDRVDLFDPLFFGISPREAVSMDPQHRLLLEVSWEALERAGIAPERLAGSRTGVFLGICSNDYGMLALKSLPPERTDTYGSSGCATSIASGRLSYLLGLQGPSISVDTACSASLVAVHLACQSLRSRESDLALAAGVNVILMPEVTISFSRAHMMAPDGRCKTFDAAADGYVRGEGCGVVVLKRLSQALADRDPVLAVIRGSAVNQDGRSAGLTAPNGRAQEAVIREALSNAGVEPSQVNYIEAHGTGTSLGDPIEMRALGAAIGQGRSKDGPLVIGSVKTNIGHLEGAAGIAGLIKVVLALQRGEIPPQLHFKTPNPYIAWDELPVEVPTTLRPWPRGTARRIAGVSSFGFSGTNAHVIVEEAPIPEPATPGLDRPRHLLALSARTETALAELARQYEANFSASEPPALADACFTANAGRSHFSHRLALVVDSVPDLTARLRAVAAGQEEPGLLRGTAVVGTPPKVAFLFTGQGAQYVGMGRQLFETSPLFRQALERCDELLRPHLDQSLLSVLYPKAGEASPLDETAYTQPALFALEWALAELWRSWGIEPTVVLGHSVGEYVAACVAGVFALEEGLKLIAARGRLMQALPHGGEMAAIFADEGRVRAAIAPYSREVSLAAVNGPESVVISGEGGAVREVTRRLATAGIKSQRLTVSHAFHSPLMEPMLAEFKRVASGIRYEAPRVGLVSNLTGRLVTAREIDAAYWVRHLREPVRFQAGMEALNGLGHEVFVELGPIPTLLGMGRRCLQEGSGVWLPTLRQGRSDWEQALTSLGELYVRGANVDWAGFDRDYPRHRISLPTYPFQRERYWVEVPSRRAPRGEDKIGQLPTPDPLTEWLYELEWQPQVGEPAKEIRPAKPGSWLILADRGGVGVELAGLLEQQGERCRLVRPVGQEEPASNGHDTIDPACPEEFDALVQAALCDAPPCRGVIHLWALDSGREEPTVASLQRVQTLGCGSVLHLVQALGRAEGVELPRLWLVTRGAQRVGSQARVAVAQTPVWGLGRTIALEQPNLHCMQVDLDPSDTGEGGQALFQELWVSGPEDQVAFRGENRYVARLVRAKAPVTAGRPGSIQADGTYLTTGGLGGLGLTVARRLVEQGARHLVLLGRREPRAEARQAIAAMEAQGASVRVFQADVSRQEDIAHVLAEIERSLPPLRGVVHAAEVLDDGVLLQQDWERFQRVMAPKVEGAWNLHILTRHCPLDFFVLFSSMASLMGSPGQGNYAAANAFLDGLAWQRRSEGLPGLSINWGPWAEVGMAAALGQPDQQRRVDQGMGLIAPAQGMRVLGKVLSQNSAQVAVLPIDWLRVFDQFPMGTEPPVLAHLRREEERGSRPVGSPTPPREAMVSAPPEERQRLLVSYLCGLVSRVLQLPVHSLDHDQPLRNLGLDSLMAVELRNRIEADFGLSAPLVDLLSGPSIVELTSLLLKRFEIEGGRSTAPAVAEQATTALESESVFPLSHGQQGLWFIHQMDPQSSAYNFAFAARIRSALDLGLLSAVLRGVTDHHPALRTTFEVGPAGLRQRVHQCAETLLELIDASGWSDAELECQVAAASKRPFDLERGPVFRASLFTRSLGEQVLLLTFHHIVFDGWSLGVFLRHVAVLHSAGRMGRQAVLPPPKASYGNFVRWQSNLLEGPEEKRLWQYWRGELAGDLPVLDLPTDHPRPAVQIHRGASYEFLICEELWRDLKALASAEGATPFMVLLAGFQILLHEFSSQTDFLVGIYTSGRTRSEFEDVIGYFVNPVVLRADLSGDPTFRAYLGQVREKVVGALCHADFPFSVLANRLRVRRDPSRSPIFQVAFNLLKLGMFDQATEPAQRSGRVDLGGLDVEPFPLAQQEGQFDLDLALVDAGPSVSATLKYNTDLFDAGTVAQMAAHFVILLDGITGGPDRRISALVQLLGVARAERPCGAALFAEQVRSHGGQAAGGTGVQSATRRTDSTIGSEEREEVEL